jgi:glycosyltransferase involved in cell wall biosynthesis
VSYRILINDYAGHPFQAQLSRELSARGHQVLHAYFAEDPGPKGSLQTSPGDPAALDFAAVSLGRPYDKGALLRRWVDDRGYGRRIGALIAQFKPDFVLSANTPLDAQQMIVGACARTGSRLIIWVQDLYSMAIGKLLGRRSRWLGTAMGHYYGRMELAQFRRADALVLITDDFLKVVDPESARKAVVVQNWGSLADIRPMPKGNAWAIENRLVGRFNFVYTGTLGLKHDPTLLVALAEAFREEADVIVVGQGAGMEIIRQAREAGLSNLKAFPPQPMDCYSGVLGSADVTVALLEADAGLFSVPSKVQSYLCAERPVLLSAPEHNLATRTVREVEAGIAVQPGRRSEFLEAAARLFRDADYRVACARRARHYAEEHYSIDGIADRFTALFDAVGSAGGPVHRVGTW